MTGQDTEKFTEKFVEDNTDIYFRRTKRLVEKHGDQIVTYAVFMRRPVISAPRIALDWLRDMGKQRGADFKIDLMYPEGDMVGAGEPIYYITGSFTSLADLETIFLQKTGSACVAAYNAYTMAVDLPEVNFIAFGARHCAGVDMAEMMDYAASVGSMAAKAKIGAKGFIGNANKANAHYFGNDDGLGTIPHALIGYAGSTLRAAQMFHDEFPDIPLIVLNDYFGREITDSLEVCRAFPELAQQGRLSFRLDTAGSRFVEGLDIAASYAVLERHVPEAIRGYRTKEELDYLVGPGVSAAAIWHFRDEMDRHGFNKVNIVASSGFGPHKCRIMAEARAPVDTIGTGSYLPQRWNETYATADIITYDGVNRVKIGREFLYPKSGKP